LLIRISNEKARQRLFIENCTNDHVYPEDAVSENGEIKNPPQGAGNLPKEIK
jgi:hypothetical protein